MRSGTDRSLSDFTAKAKNAKKLQETLSDGKTVILDHPLRLPPGRVRVIVEPLPSEQDESHWLDQLYAIRQSLRESGYQFRSKEEIDAQIRSERESWER